MPHVGSRAHAMTAVLGAVRVRAAQMHSVPRWQRLAFGRSHRATAVGSDATAVQNREQQTLSPRLNDFHTGQGVCESDSNPVITITRVTLKMANQSDDGEL